MFWKRKFALGLAAALSSAGLAQAQFLPAGAPPVPTMPQEAKPAPSAKIVAVSGQRVVSEIAAVGGADKKSPDDKGPQGGPADTAQAAAPEPPPALGPTPLLKVGILQKAIYGDAEKVPINVAGWMDFDYTFRSTGRGINNVAPVQNRFGDEFLVRELGLYLWRPLKPDELSFGFNMIFIGGADASFLTPTAGGWANTNPRFGSSFTDLNVTAHLPILSEGGVDVKAGRQTTILGPMGALPWQRYFTSADYAWYNMEEGRYTGVSTVWHVNKRLDWYNGVEIGGWGVFFDNAVRGVDYITNVSYWLDEDAKNTKAWFTVLTGPTSFTPGQRGLNTTVLELGVQHNWNENWYQILDSQMVWSRGPVFGAVAPGYNERAYDVYTYIGRHITEKLDINSRFEWYYDQDGGGYPGGFGVRNTHYYAVTFGPDIHPTKWLQVRPEIRYDYASKPNFGPNNNLRNQLSLAIEALFKF